MNLPAWAPRPLLVIHSGCCQFCWQLTDLPELKSPQLI